MSGERRLYDGIDLCSDGNTAQSNVVYGSAESGIHVDGECPPSTGINNTVTGNTINEACAGILYWVRAHPIQLLRIPF